MPFAQGSWRKRGEEFSPRLQVAEGGSLLALMSCVAAFRQGGFWKIPMGKSGIKGQ